MLKIVCTFLPILAFTPQAVASDADTANQVATFFLVARDSVAKRKQIISDPKKFPKEDSFVNAVMRAYKTVEGKDFDKSAPHAKDLVKAIMTIVSKARAGEYNGNKMWKDVKYSRSNPKEFSGKFLPARFATEVQKEFNKISAGRMTLKLTVPDDLLVNVANAPDAWESAAFSKILKTGKLGKGSAYSEKVGGKFRFLLPEAYKGGCLPCHAGEAGARIHKSGKPGVAGGLGGGISITM